MENNLDKNTLASVHINFLFGAGVNGTAFPQLSSFSNTLAKIVELGGNVDEGLECGIDSIDSSNSRKIIKEAFIEEFMVANGKVNELLKEKRNVSLQNLEKLFRKTYTLVQEAQNRNPSMKQINIYTLNYDQIVERILGSLGYFFNEISASNTSTMATFLDVIGYNYNVKKYIPSFMISKLHGDIDNPIIPSKSKYQEVLNENYFEIAFNMKEKLCRQNSILIVIGYSGKDNHINKILQECINAGLILYWYKYSKDDYIPFEPSAQVIINDQEDYENRKDSTERCFCDMERAWEEKSGK